MRRDPLGVLQFAERARGPPECGDRGGHHHLEAGRHGLHHVDLLLPQARHESQVRDAHCLLGRTWSLVQVTCLLRV